MIIIDLNLFHSHSSVSDWMHLCSYWAAWEIWPIYPTIGSKIDFYFIFRQTIDNDITVHLLAALTVLFHPCTGFVFCSIIWIDDIMDLGTLYAAHGLCIPFFRKHTCVPIYLIDR